MQMTRRKSPGSILIELTLLSFATWSLLAAETRENPFRTCEAEFDGDRRSAQCFYEVASNREAPWSEAASRLSKILGENHRNPWLYLYLGHVLQYDRRPDEAERSYRDGVAVSDQVGDVAAQVEIRLALTQYLGNKGLIEEGDEVLAPAVELAEKLGDPLLLAEVRIRQAWQYRYHGRDLDYAHVLLQEVERGVFDDEVSYDLKLRWLRAMTTISGLLGRNDEAFTGYERTLALALESGDGMTEATTRYALAAHFVNATLPSPDARRKARSLYEAALKTAEAVEHPFAMARAHFGLGSVLGRDRGRKHFEACLDIASELGDLGLSLKSYCLGALAATYSEEDPRRASQLIDQALETVRGSNDLWAAAYGSADRLHVSWATRERPEATAESLEILDALETLLELQGSGDGRAGLTTLLSQAYYTLSGYLLEGSVRGDVELAFTVIERMRARVLLETLEAARAAAPPPSADAFVQQLGAVLQRKVELNRLLLRPGLEPSARERAITELDAVETEESGLRHEIARASPSYGALTAPDMPSLSEIEESLGETEALLSFQVGLDESFLGGFGGGSWLLASTRGGTRAYRLPDRVALEPALDMMMGVADLDSAPAALVRLYQDLLGGALADLPAAVERLVIIPDGKLYRLPFGLLRPAADDPPVVSRYQTSIAPSATLWRRWRRLDPPTSEIAALALADPDLASGYGAALSRPAPGASRQRQWALAQGARLERLPHAREEGKAVVRTLGRGSRLLVGAEATERFLKESDLSRYGVLHFAAHAVINDELPERSAILLAPGADDEDGWLQPQDISELELDGRVVVLASCNSAAGRVLRGEGPMSLARSFFYAGAPVVVASLWPLPDDETARLFKEFYESLAKGSSVAGALAAAQRQMLDRGAPARAWAGLVALGNGDLVPFPGGLEKPGLPLWIYLAVAALALALLLLVTRARGDGRRTPSSSRRGGGEPSR